MDKERWIRRFEHPNPIISINNNQSCTIENISINIPTYPMPQKFDQVPRFSSSDFRSMDIGKKRVSLSSAMDRQIYLLDKLTQFQGIVTKKHIEPVFRNWALYSAFSTLWEKSTTSDLAQMELHEKDLLIGLVKSGCHVKVILNLDIEKALCCGFTKSEIEIRVADLCATCDSLSEYKNFEPVIAIDFPSYEPIFIFDSILLSRNLNFGERESYSFALWESNQQLIASYINRFDLQFMQIQLENYQMMYSLNLCKISELIFFYYQKKITDLHLYGSGGVI